MIFLNFKIFRNKSFTCIGNTVKLFANKPNNNKPLITLL